MKEGYPEESELLEIENWDFHDFKGLMDYVHDLWAYSDCGFWKQEGNIYKISTRGWSGNEEIICALSANSMFWACCWLSSRRGGHYEFEVK